MHSKPDSSKTKRILLVAYSFPPLGDPQSIRWFNLSNLLAERDYKIDVITIKLPDSLIKSSQFKLHSNITVFRIFPGFIENIAYKMKSKIGTDSAGNLIKRRNKGFRLIKQSYKFIRKIMDNLLIGDLRTEWFPFCLRFLKKIDKNSYSVLVTSQEPFVDSLIGLSIKKIQPDIRWIADMGDSILSPYYPTWRKKIDRFFEKKIVKTADRIVLTNKNLLKLISRQYGVKKSKFSVINQGFSMKELSARKHHKNRRLTLFFSGTFYKDFRDPGSLIEALSKLNIDYRLLIAGRNELFLDKFSPIADKTEFLGFISYFKSLELEKQADILINISNKQLFQVPGKFFEYLGSRRPILNIVYDENDETAKLTRELNAGVVCKNSTYEIQGAILRLYNLWKNDMLENSFYRKDTINKNHCEDSVAISAERLLRSFNSLAVTRNETAAASGIAVTEGVSLRGGTTKQSQLRLPRHFVPRSDKIASTRLLRSFHSLAVTEGGEPRSDKIKGLLRVTPSRHCEEATELAISVKRQNRDCRGLRPRSDKNTALNSSSLEKYSWEAGVKKLICILEEQ